MIARLVVMDGLIHSAKRHEVFAMGPADGIMAFPDVVMGKIDGGGFPEAAISRNGHRRNAPERRIICRIDTGNL